MELIEAFTRQDADLGSTFICEKEVTIKLNGEDLKNLHNIDRNYFMHLDEEHIQTVNELLDILLEGVTNYDLV